MQPAKIQAFPLNCYTVSAADSRLPVTVCAIVPAMPEHDPTRTDRLALYMRANADKQAAHDEAVRVVERWNTALAAGRGALWSPTIRAAVTAGTPWLDVYCPGCRTSRAIDIRKIDRHSLASVGSLVLGLRCSWCRGVAPMPVLIGLHALPPAVKRSERIWEWRSNDRHAKAAFIELARQWLAQQKEDMERNPPKLP
jgi:hypothetical protein